MNRKAANNCALLVGMLAFGLPHPVSSQNLLLNGSFDAGNTGFTTDYTFAPGNISPPGTYDVVRNPRDAHALGASFTDHTSGAGLLLAMNGATEPNLVLWRQSVNVTANTPYEFSGWAASWGDDGTGHDVNPARLQISINGSTVGPAFQLSNIDGQWQSFVVPWTSANAPTALIELRLETTAFLGNDPAFDDFQFTQIPEPTTFTVMVAGGILTTAFWLRRRTARTH
jgi:hypothetical protein